MRWKTHKYEYLNLLDGKSGGVPSIGLRLLPSANTDRRRSTRRHIGPETSSVKSVAAKRELELYKWSTTKTVGGRSEKTSNKPTRHGQRRRKTEDVGRRTKTTTVTARAPATYECTLARQRARPAPPQLAPPLARPPSTRARFCQDFRARTRFPSDRCPWWGNGGIPPIVSSVSTDPVVYPLSMEECVLPTPPRAHGRYTSPCFTRREITHTTMSFFLFFIYQHRNFSSATRRDHITNGKNYALKIVLKCQRQTTTVWIERKKNKNKRVIRGKPQQAKKLIIVEQSSKAGGV